eukprot:scaffold4282_cov112-Cylindrotheca_fusiformis.AAC.17
MAFQVSPRVLIVGIGIAIGHAAFRYFNRKLDDIFHSQNSTKGRGGGDRKNTKSISSLTTVTFNIGGHLYEVSRSLLRQYPDTILAKKAEEIPYGMSLPIMFDRDGERFRYCLEFMRDGRVSLPVSASRQAVLEDLKFYGFVLEDENLVDGSSAHAAAAGHIFSNVREARVMRRVRPYIMVIMDDIALQWSSNDNALLNESLAMYGLCCQNVNYDESSSILNLTLNSTASA